MSFCHRKKVIKVSRTLISKSFFKKAMKGAVLFQILTELTGCSDRKGLQGLLIIA
jgi:hypothetical protein